MRAENSSSSKTAYYLKQEHLKHRQAITTQGSHVCPTGAAIFPQHAMIIKIGLTGQSNNARPPACSDESAALRLCMRHCIDQPLPLHRSKPCLCSYSVGLIVLLHVVRNEG